MRRLTVALAAVLALIFSASALAAQQKVYVVNDSEQTSDATVATMIAAYQKALDEDFAPHWNTGAELVLADAPEGAWKISLVDAIACWFCSGYHDVGEDGAPFAEVLVDLSDPLDTQVTFGHELFELLVNPYIDRAVMGPRRWWALETADPVEDDTLAYERDGVRISDFVLPAWFRPASSGPWDFAGHTTKPRQILDGGYQLYWAAGTWHGIFVGGEARLDAREKAKHWSSPDGWSWGD